MGKTVLLTLGRLPKGLELARALHQAGHRVLVADPFGLHLCKPSRAVARSFKVPPPATDQEGFLNALAEIARAQAVDVVIPVSEEVMHVSLLGARLPPGTQLLCEPHDTLIALHDKFAFMRNAAKAGFRTPETYLGDDLAAAALAAGRPIVAKARFGCSGSGLHFLGAGQPLPPELRAPDWVIQRQVNGREVSTLSFCRDGEILGHVVYRGLVLSGTVAVAFERVEVPAVDAWVRGHVADAGYSGFIAFDFMVDAQDTAWPLECNPRLTSGVHFMHPEDLAALAMGGALDHPLRLKQQIRFQEGHTALTMAYAQLASPKKAWSAFKAIARSRDVLWSPNDPWVFPLMTPMSWPVLRQVMLGGRSFGEAATYDIEWLPASGGVDNAETRIQSDIAEASAS